MSDKMYAGVMSPLVQRQIVGERRGTSGLMTPDPSIGVSELQQQLAPQGLGVHRLANSEIGRVREIIIAHVGNGYVISPSCQPIGTETKVALTWDDAIKEAGRLMWPEEPEANAGGMPTTKPR